jgi:hypothetical protein
LGLRLPDDVLAALDAYRNPDHGYGVIAADDGPAGGPGPPARPAPSRDRGASVAVGATSDAPSRSSFKQDDLAADLDRLAGQQQSDGGWPISFRPYSPAGELEWRGCATVQAITVLDSNGVLRRTV